MHCVKFIWNWLGGFHLKKQNWIFSMKGCLFHVWLKLAKWFCRFLNNLNVWFLFCVLFYYYLPFIKGVALCSTNLNPLHQRLVCAKDWLNLTQWFCRRFSNEVNVFLLLSLLGKGHGPLFEHTWLTFTHKSYVLNLVEVGPVVLEKIFKSSLYSCY